MLRPTLPLCPPSPAISLSLTPPIYIPQMSSVDAEKTATMSCVLRTQNHAKFSHLSLVQVRFACFACCQEFYLVHLYPPSSSTSLLPNHLSTFLRALDVRSAVTGVVCLRSEVGHHARRQIRLMQQRVRGTEIGLSLIHI